MNRLFLSSTGAVTLALLAVSPTWAQKQPAPPPSRPPASSPSATPSVGSSPNREALGPLYINGRVLMETGQPVPEPVSVGLNCGMQTLQSIHTDAKGYFQFVLGAGPQSNVDFSASDDTTPTLGGMSGMNGPFGSAPMMGCELRVDVSGYEPVSKTITTPPDIGGIDAGTILLRRRNGVEGTSISVTSLQVPEKARKEFEQGQKDERSNKLPSAEQHMLKAIALYDKYAAAWNELGKIQATNHDVDKARESFAKAATVDPHYVPPFISLAALDLQSGKYDEAIDEASKVLALDSTIGFASFVQAAADVKLNKMDDAEKSAKDAENEPHQAFPQVHVLLADLFFHKEDYSNAATQLRAYLKEAPKGPFAVQAKKNLDEIENQAKAGSTPGPGAEQPQTAP